MPLTALANDVRVASEFIANHRAGIHANVKANEEDDAHQRTCGAYRTQRERYATTRIKGCWSWKRDSNGYRIFEEDDITRVTQIKTMIAAGLGTRDPSVPRLCQDRRRHPLLAMCPNLRSRTRHHCHQALRRRKITSPDAGASLRTINNRLADQTDASPESLRRTCDQK